MRLTIFILFLLHNNNIMAQIENEGGGEEDEGDEF